MTTPFSISTNELVITIEDGETESGVALLNAMSIAGIESPASSGVSSLTFKRCSTEDGTFVDVKDEFNNAKSVATDSTNAAFYELPLSEYTGYGYFKLVANTAVSGDKEYKVSIVRATN